MQRGKLGRKTERFCREANCDLIEKPARLCTKKKKLYEL